MEKKCPKCLEIKSFTLFYKNKHSKTNTSPYCKVCSNLRSTSYARNNKNKIPTTGYSLKRRYGISSLDYEKLLLQQNNVCKICHSVCKTGRNLAVDHDHISKKIRGLLCSNCNQGLGNFKDSQELLEKAILYLKINA